LVVTRPTATTWEVEPKAAGCNLSPAVPSVGRLLETPTVGKLKFTDDGLYYMPFKMLLTAK
jgi:hypothetical protein